MNEFETRAFLALLSSNKSHSSSPLHPPALDYTESRSCMFMNRSPGSEKLSNLLLNVLFLVVWLGIIYQLNKTPVKADTETRTEMCWHQPLQPFFSGWHGVTIYSLDMSNENVIASQYLEESLAYHGTIWWNVLVMDLVFCSLYFSLGCLSI